MRSISALGLLLILLAVAIGQATTQKNKQTNGTGTKTTAAKAKPTPAANTKGSDKTTQAAKKTVAPKPKATPAKEADEYAKAASIEEPEARIAALKAFLKKFPSSIRKNEILESIAITRIKLAQEKLTAGDTPGGVGLLKTTISELPMPVPEKLFADSLSKIPVDLFNNGERNAAIDIALLLEDKAGTNGPQLLALANFYLMTEYGDKAQDLAEKAVAATPSADGYQTLGLANRLNFKLDEASQNYARALELEPDSAAILRNLADLKRAQGKTDEAIDLYKKVLDKDAENVPAQTGLVLALFNAGKRGDAEAEMQRSLEANPSNVILLAGAAYWYAGHGEADKAIQLAQSAIEKEPRYIWSHIALGHGYLAKKQPAEAEKALLKARQYGNFPTLEYEIASARLMSGFYRDATEGLQKSFVLKDGLISTKLGGRVELDKDNFIDLLADERLASTFEPESSDDKETAAKLKDLLVFDAAVNAPQPNEDAAAKAADAFIAGGDSMKLHRQLYAASALLNKRMALTKVEELAAAAVDRTDTALEVPDPGAAVMASELYDSRTLALTRGELIQVPSVPRNTLSAILRGRIEDIAGWTLFNENRSAEAVVRLRRAVGVMPAQSAWWREAMWHLGAALQADGKETEALDCYIKSYSIDKPNAGRYIVVESLYKKLHGSTDGLEAKIGADPSPAATEVAKTEPSPTPVKPTLSESDNSGVPIKVDPTPTPEISPTPSPLPTEPDKIPTNLPATTVTPSPAVEATPLPSPAAAEPTTTPLTASQTTPVSTSVTEPTPMPEIEAASPTQSPAPTQTTANELDAKTNADGSVNAKKVEPTTDSPAKPLFEPVIITIPNSASSKKNSDEKRSDPENAQKNADEKTEKKDPEGSEKSADETVTPKTDTSAAQSGEENKPVEIPPCKIGVSQDAISILNNGGSLGILLQIDNGNLKEVKAVSNAPDDLKITLEPEIAGVKGQAFYVIRSTTTKTGDFNVAFIAPCGRKEIAINVR